MMAQGSWPMAQGSWLGGAPGPGPGAPLPPQPTPPERMIILTIRMIIPGLMTYIRMIIPIILPIRMIILVVRELSS